MGSMKSGLTITGKRCSLCPSEMQSISLPVPYSHTLVKLLASVTPNSWIPCECLRGMFEKFDILLRLNSDSADDL